VTNFSAKRKIHNPKFQKLLEFENNSGNAKYKISIKQNGFRELNPQSRFLLAVLLPTTSNA